MAEFDAFLVQPPVAAEPAAEAAEHLLVEQQQRRARQAVEDDETDRIRSDIDDADAPFPRASWPRASRRRAFLPHGAARRRILDPATRRQAFLKSSKGAFLDFLSALPRPERLGLVMK